MKHRSNLRKFLNGIILQDDQDLRDIDPRSGYTSGRIPNEFLSESEKKTEHAFHLYIADKDYYKFNNILNDLKKDQSTEHLTKKQLKEKLWYLLCEIYVNREFYRKDSSGNLKIKIDEFLSDICRPPTEYEIIFRILNADMGESPVRLWNCQVTNYDRDSLINWGLNKKDNLTTKLLSEFADKTIMILTEIGNSEKFVLERARKTAEFNLKVLQTFLSEQISLRDEQLLFKVSEHALIKHKDSSKEGGYGFSWRAHRKPYGLKFGGYLNDFIGKANSNFDLVRTFNTSLQLIVERTIYWIGKAINESEYDQKIIALCTAMETLLTTEDDRRKGEAIAYRMILLNMTLDKHFSNPLKILRIYELRSEIIHGSSLFVATDSEYHNMLYIVRETLCNFIKLVKDKKIKKHSKLIQNLESSNKVENALKFLENFKGRYSDSIKSALLDAIQNNDNQLGVQGK